jgi:iron complex transport system substrate-binding protein
MLSLWLAACGQQPAQSGSAKDAPAQSQSSAPNSAGGTGNAAVVEEKRTVKDAMGEQSIPARPKRIVVLNTGALETLLSLGVKPIGAPYSIPESKAFFKHLAAQTAGIENVGTVDQPNLETIAKLAPDLIIAQKEDNEAVYDSLKRIAPVYMYSAAPQEWKKAFAAHAEAVNRSEDAKKIMQAYDSKVTAFKTAMGKRLTEMTVTLIRPRADHVRIQLPGSFSGAVVQEAGLLRPGKHQTSLEHNISVKEEQIGSMDADVILSFGREHEAEFFKEKIVKNPLWATLKAVQKNAVHYMDWEIWLSGQGIQSANIILDDLNRIFVK